MGETTAGERRATGTATRPALGAFAHVSLPCRDITEGKKFYVDLLGGQLRVDQPTFCSVVLGGVDVGFGTEGVSFVGEAAEYPHIAFFVDAATMAGMRDWLMAHGVPCSNYWTRQGVEALMFFRDPSGNMIELYCKSGVPGADKFPKGPPRGHGVAVDIESLRYDRWTPPA
jgi:catechol 2,3-dioxygenase-like lactoylglutathione lyase family enzyme